MAELTHEESIPLQTLLKAQSKATVLVICRESFYNRNGKVPHMIMASTAKTLDIQPAEVTKLFNSLCVLIKMVLMEGLEDAQSIAAVFPSDFHKNLKGLLSETIASNLAQWKEKILMDQVSLPHLVDFDWRVDIKTSSDNAARIAQPTCIVQMKIQDTLEHSSKMAGIHCVNVEFSRETLDTMLDGLGKIRDQLSSVAKH